MSQTYTVKQVAEILGYSTNSIYSFLKENRIKGVRVGKGRFRITQEELGRIMHLSKRQDQTPITPVQNDQPQAITPANSNLNKNSQPEKQDASDMIYAIHSLRFSMPSLFDWFVAVSSILLGFSMFLFNRYSDTADVSRFVMWLMPLQVILIIGGFGVLFNDTIKGVGSRWNRIFHGALFIAYVLFTFIRLQVGDGGGSVLYGIIALTVLISLIRESEGVWKFVSVPIGYSLALPILFFSRPDLVNLPNQLQFIQEQPLIYIPIWLVVASCFAFGLWQKYEQKKQLVWLPVLAYAIGFFMLSFWFANTLAWGKSVTTLVMAITMLIVPGWMSITPRTFKDRMPIFAMFIGITVVLSILLSTLWLMERNVKEYAGHEMLQKVEYGEIFVESAFNMLQKATEEAGRNQVAVDAIGKKDKDELTRILRLTYESSNFMKTIATFDRDGNLLAIYPYTNATIGNYSQKIYFQQAVKTKKTYISSEQFELSEQNKSRNSIVAVPIVGADGNIDAVLTSELDIETLGTRLQKTATAERGEYFVVVNAKGQRIIHPEQSLIGERVNPVNKIDEQLTGSNGINEGYSSEGSRILVAFTSLKKQGWIIALHAPIIKVLAPTHSANVLIFGGIIVSLVTIFLFLSVIRVQKWKNLERL